MKKALALTLVCIFGNQAMAGGTIGGVPPSVHVEMNEFQLMAMEALKDGELVFQDETMEAEILDFKDRTMVFRSKADPSKVMTVKGTPAASADRP
jgi:hypothetical protein